MASRRYAWDGEVQFPSESTNNSPVRDENDEDIETTSEKEKKERKYEKIKRTEVTEKEKPEKEKKKERKAEKPENQKEETDNEKPEKEKKKKEKITEKPEKQKEETDNEKPEKENKKKAKKYEKPEEQNDEAEKEKTVKKEKKERKTEKAEKQNGETEKEKPEKERKKKSANVQPAPDELASAIETIVYNRLLPDLVDVFIRRFCLESASIVKGRSAQECILDRKSEVHKKFREFCISRLCVDEIDCLDALMELLDYKSDYDAFMNRFHGIWETYFNHDGKVHLDDEIFAVLKKHHDVYWDMDDKTETPEKQMKEKKKEKPEKEKKAKEKKPEKLENQNEETGKAKKEKEKMKTSANVQPAPVDLIDAINHDIMDRLIPDLELEFATFPEVSACKAKGLTLDDCIFRTGKDKKLEKKFREFCISRKCVNEVTSLDDLNKLLQEDKHDYDAFMIRFHAIWEKYFKCKLVCLPYKSYVSLEECHDEYWDEANKKPK